MPNALAQESSPYLRQHADNPVNWQPWSPQALEQARKENKPILLSIGYSACHWCHVMAHESFESDATAAIMNRHFINIKVDREERPDIDRIYQLAHQLITRRSGGWPLTMFLSPEDQLPFFGGTYFPDQPKYGMMAFTDLLTRIAEVFQQENDKIRQQAVAIQQALIDIEMSENQNQEAAQESALDKFDAQLLEAYDPHFGGFGQAPKFPQAAILSQALRRAASKGQQDDVYRAIDFSLQKIAMGGIQDHLRGGFYRYSVDDKWMIPHFEKMLYDNGQLLLVFAQAYRLTGNRLFRKSFAGIVTWLETEMRTEAGAFHAALDADSEGVEGKFYLWNPTLVEQLIDSDFYPAFAYKFGLDQAANFEGEWHLHAYHDDQQVMEKFDLAQEEFDSKLEQATRDLLEHRATRIRPGLDDKVLTSWNALAIRGLATGARMFNQESYYRLAKQCLWAIRQECWHDERLLALSTTSGKQLPAYLDDYAHLLQGTLDCLQFEWHSDDLAFAMLLADQLLAYFEDATQGGFFFTASDHEQLIQRPKSWQDEAMPSGNAVAALAIHRLGLLVGNQLYTRAATKALQSVADNINQTPFYAAGFLALLEEVSHPPLQIILRGDEQTLDAWREQILPALKPGHMVFFIPSLAENLPDSIAQKSSDEGISAWVCEGFSCRAPIFDLEALLAVLE